MKDSRCTIPDEQPGNVAGSLLLPQACMFSWYPIKLTLGNVMQLCAMWFFSPYL